MKKVIVSVIILLSIVVTATRGSTQFNSEMIDTVKLTGDDLPEGFVYGKIPEPYKKTLKDNPWLMDRPAIKRLAGMVYPGGDYNRITGMHVSIIADKKTPYGDDIVCYVIVYSGMKAAEAEIKKISEFTWFNRDRAILLTKENLAVIMFVDDVNNFHLIQELARTMEDRLKNI